jgi:hypothetical protein
MTVGRRKLTMPNFMAGSEIVKVLACLAAWNITAVD